MSYAQWLNELYSVADLWSVMVILISCYAIVTLKLYLWSLMYNLLPPPSIHSESQANEDLWGLMN